MATLLLGLVAALALPAGASALACAGGDSSISQLYETLPSASCDQPHEPSRLTSLPPRTARRLAADGAIGGALARLLALTLPTVDSSKRSQPGGRGRGALPGLLSVILPSWSDGGTGIVLSVFLLGVLLLALARVLVHRRSPPR